MNNFDDNILITDFSTPFTKMVDEDIERCEKILDSEFDKKDWQRLHIELTSKYFSYVSNIGDNMYNYYPDGSFFDIENLSIKELQHNIIVIMNRLIAYKNFGYKNMETDMNGIHIANNLMATQTQNINISFEDVKKQIEDMSGLSEAETKETLDKIDEIKAIVELEEPKKSKWQKIKPILVWLADKSVDVGIALLPLLMKVGC